MKRTGKLHIDRFLAATAAGEDEKAEALVPLLTAADIPALHAMVVAPDVDIRWWAIRALAEVGNAASVRILVDALANDDADLRAVAAMSLGELHTTQPAAVNACLADLAARLADEDGQVRMAAVTVDPLRRRRGACPRGGVGRRTRRRARPRGAGIARHRQHASRPATLPSPGRFPSPRASLRLRNPGTPGFARKPALHAE
ncbi:MAG: HEAT repeat domain-containing protein [Caldilineaceae bacterium]